MSRESNRDIRCYLSMRAAHVLAEIDRLHRELDTLNHLMRVAHQADAIRTEPPIERTPSTRRTTPVDREPMREAERPVTPPLPPLAATRPRLTTTKSSPNIKVWPEPATNRHPLHRTPRIPSQSRYPLFTNVSA